MKLRVQKNQTHTLIDTHRHSYTQIHLDTRGHTDTYTQTHGHRHTWTYTDIYIKTINDRYQLWLRVGI